MPPPPRNTFVCSERGPSAPPPLEVVALSELAHGMPPSEVAAERAALSELVRGMRVYFRSLLWQQHALLHSAPLRLVQLLLDIYVAALGISTPKATLYTLD